MNRGLTLGSLKEEEWNSKAPTTLGENLGRTTRVPQGTSPLTGEGPNQIWGENNFANPNWRGQNTPVKWPSQPAPPLGREQKSQF